MFIITLLLTLLFKQRPFPPGPPTEPTWFGRQTAGLPTILPWKVYHQWSKSLGPLLTLSLPGTPPRKVLLLSTPSAIHALFHTRSAIYSTRPAWEMADLIGRRNNVAFTPYGPRLKRARRFLSAALGPKVVPSREALLDGEVNSFLSQLVSLDENQRARQLSTLLEAHVADIATLFTYGHRASPIYIAESERINADTGMSLIPGRWAVEGFPILKYLPSTLPGMAFKRWAIQARKRFDDLVGREFEDARRLAQSGTSPRCLVTDALDAALTPEEASVLKSTAGSVYGAATDTTSAILHSALHLLSLHPSVQSAAHAHVSSHTGTRLPATSDECALPYITALIREVHRFRPVVNLISHAPREDDVFEGWRVDKGVWVMGNVWSVCHDEDLYPDPDAFRPERHLDSAGGLDPAVKDPREVTFGFGRRRCPGEHFANAQMFLFLTRVIYMFEILPEFQSEPEAGGTTAAEKMEYTSTFISRPKREHFDVRLRLRLDSGVAGELLQLRGESSDGGHSEKL